MHFHVNRFYKAVGNEFEVWLIQKTAVFPWQPMSFKLATTYLMVSYTVVSVPNVEQKKINDACWLYIGILKALSSISLTQDQ